LNITKLPPSSVAPPQYQIPEIIINTVSVRPFRSFNDSVSRILKARGISSSQKPDVFLSRLLKDSPDFWLAKLQRPAVGSVGVVQFNKIRGGIIGDCSVVFSKTQKLEGPHNIFVKAVFGRCAFCELRPKLLENDLTTETHDVIMSSAGDITVLYDIVPHLNCLTPMDVWANETVPLFLLVQKRPGLLTNPEPITVVSLATSSKDFTTWCAKCDGSGHLTCNKCEGTGIYKPRANCRRCGGSGDFIGKYGDVMGDCRTCNGTGHFAQLDCGRCQGFGQIPCNSCNSTGRQKVSFDPGLSQFHINVKKTKRIISGQDVHLFDWQTSQKIVLSAPANVFKEHLKYLSTTTTTDPRIQELVREHGKDFSLIKDCLRKSMESTGLIERDNRPLEVGQPLPSANRSRSGVIYDFPVYRVAKKQWWKEGTCPYPLDDPVIFEGKDGTELKIPLQNSANSLIDNAAVASVAGCNGQQHSYHLEIKLPKDVDISLFPDRLLLKRDQPPPAEKKQIHAIEEWCSIENADEPVINGIFSPLPEVDETPPNHLFNPGLANFPSQVRAVNIGLSRIPIGLIKGPPGTGKTTVITEIVRQATAIGERVLVCSQTHTAVQNVLEKLHAINEANNDGVNTTYRMLRHGREEKLTDLELRYKAGGSGDQYFKNIIDHVCRQLALHDSHVQTLSTAQAKLPAALQAAQALNIVRHDTAKAFIRVEARAREALTRLSQLKTSQLRTIDSVATRGLEDNTNHNNQANRELAKVKKVQRQQQSIMASAEARYKKRTGNSPTTVEVNDGFASKLAKKMVPNILASNNLIQQRYSMAKQLGNRAATTQTELENKIQEIASKRSSIKKKQSGLGNLAKDNYQKRSERTDSWKTRNDTELAEALAEQTAVHQATQLIASDLVPSEYQATNDMEIDVWEDLILDVATDINESQRRIEFMTKWKLAVESQPQILKSFYWDNIQVFFSTCVGLAGWRKFIDSDWAPIDLVIIDEAGQATAAETIIPLLQAKRAILIGDDMQLQPKKFNDFKCGDKCSELLRQITEKQTAPEGDIAQYISEPDCWLEYSFFEWIWKNRDNVFRIMLDTQFRMHPDIANFVGHIFYSGHLKTEVSADERKLGFGEFNKPICLISTSAYPNHHETMVGHGYSNPLEAQIIHQVIDRAEQELDSSQSFGIITPYTAQKQCVSKLLESSVGNLKYVDLTENDIKSVDGFQGEERDVIIISFVRSPTPCSRCKSQTNNQRKNKRCSKCFGKGHSGSGLTFVRDLRRLNVAFSRARKMLILVGDFDTLKDPQYHGGRRGSEVLTEFSDYIADKGKVLHLWETGKEDNGHEA